MDIWQVLGTPQIAEIPAVVSIIVSVSFAQKPSPSKKTSWIWTTVVIGLFVQNTLTDKHFNGSMRWARLFLTPWMGLILTLSEPACFVFRPEQH